MTPHDPLRLALGGSFAIAAALGIGRFVYTPILPSMIDALYWTNADAGVVASANFLGYLAGALASAHRTLSSYPHRWMLVALAVSAASTAATGISTHFAVIAGLRFAGGIASAVVLVCASALVIEQLMTTGRSNLVALHFGGMGLGVVVSSAAVAALNAGGGGWRAQWIASGLLAALFAISAHVLIRPGERRTMQHAGRPAPPINRATAAMILSYGLFGFGYVITATFLVTIVRRSADLAAFEPWVWILFGAAAMPSVLLWQRLASRLGLIRAYALACLVEAIGVVACVVWPTVAGVSATSILLGGTILGITALGLMSGRALAGGQSQRIIGLMTASFGLGQVIGPPIGGAIYDATASFLAASLAAASALAVAAVLGYGAHRYAGTPDAKSLS
jgi:predicted MFS family arabinose efflux permease